MPQITSDPGILRAARTAVGLLLKFKGQPIVLSRKGDPIVKPGGGRDFADRLPMAPQTLVLAQVGGDIVEDGEGGLQTIKRNYTLTGAHDADVHIGDIWQDAEADYLVKTVNDDNHYKVVCEVVGTIKVPDSTLEAFAPFSLGVEP